MGEVPTFSRGGGEEGLESQVHVDAGFGSERCHHGEGLAALHTGAPGNTKGYSSTYLAMVFANVRAST